MNDILALHEYVFINGQKTILGAHGDNNKSSRSVLLDKLNKRSDFIATDEQ